ncbi:MAG: hypothetical protein NW241_13955 [Bacteroidia bacterium]|nr:hypothetical protein [Bacteroidia bacterium]
MNARLSGFLALAVLVYGWGCGSGTPSQPAAPAASAPAPQQPDSRQQITAVLQAYYQDLSNEQIDVARYFAPVLTRFFSSENLPREKAGESLRNGFAAPGRRIVTLDPASLTVTEIPGGFVAEFSGYARPEGDETAALFRNRVTFDAGFLITAYETLDNSRQAGESEALGSARRAAAIVLGEFRTGTLNRSLSLVHPEQGFCFLTHPGVMDIPNFYTNLREVFKTAPWMSSGIRTLCQTPAAEPLPDFDCDNGFARSGCFIAPCPVGFHRISTLMQDLNQADMSSYSAPEIEKARQLEALISMVVLDTENEIAFYFGEIGGAWYLLLIDKASYDCSA